MIKKKEKYTENKFNGTFLFSLVTIVGSRLNWLTVFSGKSGNRVRRRVRSKRRNRIKREKNEKRMDKKKKRQERKEMQSGLRSTVKRQDGKMGHVLKRGSGTNCKEKSGTKGEKGGKWDKFFMKGEKGKSYKMRGVKEGRRDKMNSE